MTTFHFGCDFSSLCWSSYAFFAGARAAPCLAMHRIHLGVLRSRLAMRAQKGASSTGSMTIFAGGSLALPSRINRGVPTNVRCVLCHSGHCVQHVGSDLQRRRAFEFVYFRFAISFLPCVHRIASLADAVNVAAFFLTNSCTLIGPCPVSVSTLSDSRS
jgi:hypothetical protein